jgi:hypothetical protein
MEVAAVTDAVTDDRSLPLVPGLPRDAPLFKRVAVGLRPPVLEMLDHLLAPPAAMVRTRRHVQWGPLAPMLEMLNRLRIDMRGTSPPLPAADLDRLMRLPALSETRLHTQWSRLDGRLRFTKLQKAEPAQLLVLQAAFADRWAGVVDEGLSRRLPRWLRPRQRPVEGYYMPISAWGLVAGLAWDDLDFRHAVAGRIQGFLRETHLIPPGQMPVPRLAPETYWLLLAAVGPQPRRWWWPSRWLASTKRARRFERLIGSLVSGLPGWAGFWDWWILRRLLTHSPGLPKRFDTELAEGLSALPVAPHGTEPEPFMRPGWATEWPSWLPVPPPPIATPTPVPDTPASIGG